MKAMSKQSREWRALRIALSMVLGGWLIGYWTAPAYADQPADSGTSLSAAHSSSASVDPEDENLELAQTGGAVALEDEVAPLALPEKVTNPWSAATVVVLESLFVTLFYLWVYKARKQREGAGLSK